MAVVKVPAEVRVIEDIAAIRNYLAPHGIWYENWDVGERCSADATNEEILAAYDPEIRQLMASGGYRTADVINVTPDVPNLDQMLAKFSKEHTHSEDEVRFIVKGRGIFHIHPITGPVFAIQVEGGDLINVPKGTRHWFDLCEDRTIRAIRLFQDMSGWTPEYAPDSVHEQYAPLCWGPNYLPSGTTKVQSLSI
jgi:1,2-dihydroxy-3-keto-5-methylthiopentene dioxygenase